MTTASKLILKSAFNINAFDDGVHHIGVSAEIDTMPIKINFMMQQGELYFDTTMLFDEERHGGRQVVTEGVSTRALSMPKVTQDNRNFELTINREGDEVGFELREKVKAPEPAV